VKKFFLLLLIVSLACDSGPEILHVTPQASSSVSGQIVPVGDLDFRPVEATEVQLFSKSRKLIKIVRIDPTGAYLTNDGLTLTRREKNQIRAILTQKKGILK
jgi:hypothetical protein